MRNCSAPFNQLFLHSSGDVYPCCFLSNNEEMKIGDYTKSTLKDIFISSKLKSLQSDFIQGKSNKHCSHMQVSYVCDKQQHRIFDEDFKINRLDIMLDSFCNLECIMCTNIYDKTGGFQSPFFWENNDDTFKNLKEIEVIGGEPFISPLLSKIIDKVTSINSQCKWRITTNLNYKFNAKILNTIQNVNFEVFSVSLDSLNKFTFETIRKNSDFSLIMSNLESLKTIRKDLNINMVVQKLNFKEVFDFLHFTKKNNFKFCPIFLTFPLEHSLLNQSESEEKESLLYLITENTKYKSYEILMVIKSFYDLSKFKHDPLVKMKYFEMLDKFK